MTFPAAKAKTWRRSPKGALGLVTLRPHPSRHGQHDLERLLYELRDGRVDVLGLAPLFGEPDAAMWIRALTWELARAREAGLLRSAWRGVDRFAEPPSVPRLVRLDPAIPVAALLSAPSWPVALRALRANLAPAGVFLFDAPGLVDVKVRLDAGAGLWHWGGDATEESAADADGAATPAADAEQAR